MKAWSAFYPFVLPHVIGCPNPTIDNALMEASREFCERTKVWDVWLDSQTTTGTSDPLEFSTNSNTSVIKFLAAKLAGLPIPVRSYNDMPANWAETGSGPRGAFTTDLTNFYLSPIPAEGVAVLTRVVLQPSVTASGIPDEIYRAHSLVIAEGAKAKLLMLPKQAWSDSAKALVHYQLFDMQCDAISRRVEKSFSRAPRRTTAMFF